MTFKSKRFGQNGHGHNLTSLVDCFAIILVYLLMATSLGEIELEIPKDMKLPEASEGRALTNPLIIQVRPDNYLFDHRVLGLQQLTEELKRLADESKDAKMPSRGVVIQADRRLSYADLNPVIVAGLQAGFEEIQFAVQPGQQARQGAAE